MNPSLLQIDEILWSLRGVPIHEVISRIEERGDEECVRAFEESQLTYTQVQYEMISDQVDTFRRTTRIMGLIEPAARRNLSGLGGIVDLLAYGRKIEMHALLVEGFVRMDTAGFQYPYQNPCDLMSLI